MSFTKMLHIFGGVYTSNSYLPFKFLRYFEGALPNDLRKYLRHYDDEGGGV